MHMIHAVSLMAAELYDLESVQSPADAVKLALEIYTEALRQTGIDVTSPSQPK